MFCIKWKISNILGGFMSNIVGLKTKDGVNMGVLKIDNNSIKVFDADSG
jgi:hypothetical protein